MFASSPLLLIASCQTNITNINTNNTNNDDSYILYVDDTDASDIKTIKVNLPYSVWNVQALIRSTYAEKTYNIYSSLDYRQGVVSIPSSKLVGIHFGSDWDDFNYAPNDWLGYFFAGNYLTYPIQEVNFPKNLKVASTALFNSMFEQNLTHSVLPDDFTLPQSLYYVKTNAFVQMFYNSTVVLPTHFNFPQNLTYVEASFGSEMFRNYDATSIPSDLQLPQNIKHFDMNYFCYNMFRDCSALEYNDALDSPLVIPKNISQAYYFCANMFTGCTILNNNGVPATPSEYDQIYIKRG